MRPWGLVALLVVSCAAAAPHDGSGVAQVNVGVRQLREGQVVSGVPCLTEDLPEHHSHVWLQVFLNGSRVVVPAGIGVGRPWAFEPDGFLSTGSCFAWIHTHDTSGVVHIATPQEETFTLGQLFDVWGQTLARGSALGFRGRLSVLVDGRQVDTDPRAVPLVNLESIVMELGRPPTKPVDTTFAGATRA